MKVILDKFKKLLMWPFAKTANIFIKIGKITLPLAILLSAILLMVGFYALQVSKQRSIERQQQNELKAKNEKDAEQKKQQETNQAGLNFCLGFARTSKDAFWQSEVERLGSDDGTLPAYNADRVDQTYKEAKADCFKEYPQ